MAGSSRRTLLSVVFFLAICGCLGMVFAQKAPTLASSGDSDVRDSVHQFSQVYDMVEQNYAEPVNPDKAIYNGAIPGLLHVLDPHSNFFDPKSYSLLKEDQRGKYYGVGMTSDRATIKLLSSRPSWGPRPTARAFIPATSSSPSMAKPPTT